MPRARAFDEAQVLSRAMLCFWRHGYTATGMKQLEAATQLQTSSLYNAFGSKEALFLKVLDHYYQEVMARRIEHYLHNYERPLDGVREFFSDSFVSDKRGPGIGCLAVNTSTELGPHQLAVREKLQRAFQQLNSGFAFALTQAQQRGELSAAVDTKQRAAHLLLLLNGLLVQARLADKSLWYDDAMASLETLLV